MIEVILELELDSFLVNSVGGGGELSEKMPAKSLKFNCEKISSVRQLTDNTPSANFDFLTSLAQRESKNESDKGFDGQVTQYLATHTSAGITRVTLASGASGYSTMPKGVSTGEIGRMLLAKSPDQGKVDIELVLKSDEFDAVWELTTKQGIQKAIATLVCFQLKEGGPSPSEAMIVAGVISSSLRMMPPH